jgi:hypothetical protein
VSAAPIAHPRAGAARAWFIVAGIAAAIAIVAVVQWWSYQRELKTAAQAYRFSHVEVLLTQPPFNGISTQIEGDRWLSDGPQDIVRNPESIALYDTITLKLQPWPTGSSGCSASNIVSYDVLVDAPGFTVDKLGDTSRSRAALLAPACSVAVSAPPSATPWRWNLMATQPGNHVVTLLLLARDKNQSIVDSREVDIPVFVPTPPQTLGADIGVISVIVTVLATLVGLWQRFRPRTA